MHRSCHVSLSPISPPSNSSFFNISDTRQGRIFQTFYWFLCCCCFHGKLMPAVIASRPHMTEPRVSWAKCELAQPHCSASCFRLCHSSGFLCFIFQGLAYSGLFGLLLFLCCSALLWFLFVFIFCIYRFPHRLPKGLGMQKKNPIYLWAHLENWKK